jgi:hypothetical protein
MDRVGLSNETKENMEQVLTNGGIHYWRFVSIVTFTLRMPKVLVCLNINDGETPHCCPVILVGSDSE